MAQYSLKHWRAGCSLSGQWLERMQGALQVDRDGKHTTLRPQCLADYETKIKQETLGLLHLDESPRTMHGAGHGCMAQPGMVGKDYPPLVGEQHQELAHQLSAHTGQWYGGDCYYDEGSVCPSL